MTFAIQRINIGLMSFHNPLASRRSKAADPRINALTLARISHSRDIGIRKICAENLRDRIERTDIHPWVLPFFSEKVFARAISYVRFEEMPSVSRRADRIYDGVVTFIQGCSSASLKIIATISKNDSLLGLIVFDRIPEDLAGLKAFSLIANGKSPYAKLACNRMLTFWPEMSDRLLRSLAQKSATQDVRDIAAEELRKRSGVSR